MSDASNPFHTRAVWAFDRRLQAEHDAAAIIATLQRFNITGFQSQVMYGMTAQAAIDGLSPATIPAMLAERDQFASAGIAWVPVVVPRGQPGEADAHGAIAKALGCLVVDMESDSSGDYWPWDRAGEIAGYALQLREAAGPAALIGWQPDGRLADSGRVAEWNALVTAVLPYVNVWCPQLYAGWTTYGRGQSAIDADVRRFGTFAALGQPVCPTLYIADLLGEPEAVWAAVQGQAIGVCGFRFGAADIAALETLGGMAITPLPAPEPEQVPPDFLAFYVAELEGIIAGCNDDIERAQVRIQTAQDKLKAVQP